MGKRRPLAWDDPFLCERDTIQVYKQTSASEMLVCACQTSALEARVKRGQ